MPAGTLVLDNRDSFTWNLVHLLASLGDEPQVHRPRSAADPDGLTSAGLERILDRSPPARLLISPGPGGPDDAHLARFALERCIGRMPVLGVCLGHQCLGRHFGLPIRRVPPVHGRSVRLLHDGRGLFAGIPAELRVTRYHSLALDWTSSAELEPSAWAIEPDGGRTLMALRHRHLPVASLQFHPESFLTEHGDRMLASFLSW